MQDIIAGYVSDNAKIDQAIAATMGRAEQEVMEAIELNTAGFRGGWVSSHRLGQLLKERGVKMAPQRIKAMMEALGYTTHGRVSVPIMEEELARPILYLKPFDASATVDDYRRAQGYRLKKTRQPVRIGG